MPYPDHLNNHLSQVAEKMGMDLSEMTIVKMSPGTDDRHKDLELLQGNWNDDRPWAIIDEEDHLYTLNSVESLAKIIHLLSATQSEIFQHKLEKAIWQRLPIDFEDIWEVAMDRIRRLAQSQSESTVVNIDLDWLVREIQQKYPNLFYHIDQIPGKKSNEGRRLSMHNNEQLVNHLIESGVLHSHSLIHAFKVCDRILFIPQELHPYAYSDRPFPIGMAQTISQPYTVAVMLEFLKPMIGNRILDIGSGSGWTTALLATAVGKSGFVEGVEIIPSLVEYGNANLRKAHINNASITLADPTSVGREGQFYDRILVSASAPEMPTKLFDQLKAGGILVIPIQNSIWHITKYEDGTLNAYELPGFVFVPLIL